MTKFTSMDASRREFMKRASAMSVVGAAAPLALNLAAFGSAAAATATDYKALVCIFLTGGNDNFNTVVPYDPDSHATHTALRVTKMQHTRETLAATALAPIPGGSLVQKETRQYALNPAMSALVPLFNQGKLAVQLNVGSLIEPVTKATWLNKSARLPAALFAHNTQRAFWASGKSREAGHAAGWAGRMGDLFMSDNNQSLFTAVSVTGERTLLTGDDTRAYTLTTAGVQGVNALSQPYLAAPLKQLITESRPNLLKDAYHRIVNQSLQAEATLRSTLQTSPAITGNSLGAQLEMVRRMIAAAPTLGLKRQVFFVSMDGFDLHDGFERHGDMLLQLAGAMNGFYQKTVAMGVANQVTAFTASDFGRALQGNNDGTDHGWGSDHFIMGGAVNGGRFFGKPPTLGSNGVDDVGQGRLIPTTALDQYAATLGRWFGLSDNQMLDILPNFNNFPTSRSLQTSFV
jgi:uncharacterized protein (DUF1501 family)